MRKRSEATSADTESRPARGATKKPPEDVTPDWQVPSMAAMVELHKEHEGR
jgi:hypothetical protein